jgi:TetR/AcrR family transcriptional regulator, transcriptional repressor for nem operon
MPTAATSTTRKRRSREETRQKLLDAALQVFARNGYERATVDEIVREAGFSKGAFYVHFETKEDLFWEMLKERIAAQQEMFRQTVDASLSVAENERRILEQAFNMNTHPLGPAVILEFTAHGMRDKKVRDQLAKMYESWHTFVAETLRAGQELGIVRKDIEINLLASTMMALFEGSMIQSHFAPANLRLDRKVGDLSALIAELIAAK